MGQQTLRIAVVVVNYNAGDLARAAVDSVLARDHHGHAVHVYLVDNASPDGDATLLAQAAASQAWQGRVSFLAEPENHGFGRGNNVALKAMADDPPDMVFLLNPDASLDNEAIAILAEFLRDTPGAGAAGAQIHKPDTGPVTAAFRFPSVASEFAAAVAFGPISRLFARAEVPLPADHPRGPVDWVAGAAVMFRHETLMALEGFDPAFFLYYEEVELMARLRAAGWQTWYVPEARVSHVEGASTNVRSGESARKRKPAYWYHSWQYYFRKTHGRGRALVAAFAWVAGAALNHVICVMRRREPARPLHFFGDFWAMGLRPLLGLKAKPYG